MPPPTPEPHRVSPYWSRARLVMLGASFVLPALGLSVAAGACGVNDSELLGVAGGSAGGEPTAATGAGGNDADATVPDAQPDVEEPTFAELCGEGPCSPGLPDTCAEMGARSGKGRGGAPSPVGCRVLAGDDGDPRSACVPAGQGATDDPCQQAADCRPGYACVPTEGSSTDRSTGICRQYCCSDVESCPPDAFCAARPLIDEPELDVPVCVVQTPCELLEEGSCPAGTACTVVRESGATSCVVPGEGTLCEPCACAEGFVCAAHIGRCQRLCRTDGAGEECGTGFCQGGSAGYPAGFGVCVGGDHACD